VVEHVIPESYAEVLERLAEEPCIVLAGGTDLMVQKRSAAMTAPSFDRTVIYGFHLNELKYVKNDATSIRIGAMTSYETLLFHPDTPKLLKDVIRDIAGPGIRYLATLAGNIGNASPAGDGLVALYLLDASVVLESVYGVRVVPIEQVILGPRKTCINEEEMIKEIVIPKTDFTMTEWIKVGGRRADAISKVSFAGAAAIDGDLVMDCRIALGAVYRTVVRRKDIERRFTGTKSELAARKVAILREYEKRIEPIDDQRSNKTYRKKVALNMIAAFIDRITEKKV
jgi:xanthine dehydrogenase FAD-binding subunit